MWARLATAVVHRNLGKRAQQGVPLVLVALVRERQEEDDLLLARLLCLEVLGAERRR